jgi:hypothetical protein
MEKNITFSLKDLIWAITLIVSLVSVYYRLDSRSTLVEHKVTTLESELQSTNLEVLKTDIDYLKSEISELKSDLKDYFDLVNSILLEDGNEPN